MVGTFFLRLHDKQFWDCAGLSSVKPKATNMLTLSLVLTVLQELHPQQSKHYNEEKQQEQETDDGLH